MAILTNLIINVTEKVLKVAELFDLYTSTLLCIVAPNFFHKSVEASHAVTIKEFHLVLVILESCSAVFKISHNYLIFCQGHTKRPFSTC